MARPLLIIGNKNYSSWSLRPWLLMKQAGIVFDERVIPLYEEGSREQILKLSPSGKVPCLIEENGSVWESLAICETIAERVPALWPADASARGVARAVSAEMHAGFAALRQRLPMNLRATLAGKHIEVDAARDIARATSIWDDCRRRYGAEGPFLFGGFSVADAMFAPVCFRFDIYGVVPRGAAGDYLATMLALPAMREWREAGIAEPWSIPRFENPI